MRRLEDTVRFRSRSLWISVVSSLALLAAPALAQEPVEAPPAATITPPRLLRFAEVKLAPEARPAAAVPVLLELTIDEQGRVVDARVVESGGAAIDTAVLDAVRGFEFEPARQGETPVEVKIRYRYVVE